MMIRTALLSLSLLLAQTPQTPAQLIDSLLNTIKQLQILFPLPAEQPTPAPPVVTLVASTAELTVALAAKKPNIFLGPGPYLVNNLTLSYPVVLSGTKDAVLTPLDPLQPTVLVTGSDVTVLGLKLTCGPRECLVVGRYDATDANTQPTRVTIEGNTIEANGGRRGIALHGTALTVKNNRITGFWLVGQDAQGIWGNNGAGPYVIVDNYIEASGENILFGGADPAIQGVVPGDILIRGNTLVKPVSYKTQNASVKNSVEFKNARRVLFTENVIDGWWPGGQAAPIQITPRNQDGTCTWCVVEDIAIIANTVKNAQGGFAVNILGTDNEKPSQQTSRITVSRNLFADTGGVQLLGGILGGLVVDHNTFPAIKTKLFSFDRIAGTPNILTRLTFTNNVFKSGTYGVTGDGTTTIGLQSLAAFCTVAEWTGNVIGGPTSIAWPAGQTVVSNTAFTALLDPVSFKLLNGTAGY